MNALVAVICAIVGALVYVLSSNPHLKELARGLYWAACIGLMIAFATHAVHLF